MTDAPPPDALKNLVIFIIVLAFVATIIAVAGYFIVELPAQQAGMQPPANDLGPVRPPNPYNPEEMIPICMECCRRNNPDMEGCLSGCCTPYEGKFPYCS